MKNKLNYPPIAEQPEYQSAYKKLTNFEAEYNEAQQALASLNKKYTDRIAAVSTVENDAIGAADALLAGHMEDPFPQQIANAARVVDVLVKAISAQRLVLREVNNALCREAGKQFTPQHKATVMKIAAAIQALHDANTEEWQMRDEFVHLGYMGTVLPTMQYAGAVDPNDNTGSSAYYWMQQSAPYVRALNK